MKTREQNRNNKRTEIQRFDWFIERIQTRVAFGWLSERSGEKLHAWELSRNQSILRFDVILQHDWPIEQCLLHIRVFFGGKTKSPCFDLFIHWLIKQITNTYRDHFSRSYENRSIDRENKNMWNRGRGGTRIGLYYSSFLVHSQKVSLFCNVISPLIPASVLYCLLSHWNYD